MTRQLINYLGSQSEDLGSGFGAVVRLAAPDIDFS